MTYITFYSRHNHLSGGKRGHVTWQNGPPHSVYTVIQKTFWSDQSMLRTGWGPWEHRRYQAGGCGSANGWEFLTPNMYKVRGMGEETKREERARGQRQERNTTCGIKSKAECDRHGRPTSLNQDLATSASWSWRTAAAVSTSDPRHTYHRFKIQCLFSSPNRKGKYDQNSSHHSLSSEPREAL